jgi:hypothetical protein
MRRPDFQLEVLKEGIVIRHADGHVLSYYRPKTGAVGLVEHSRYCHLAGEKSFADFLREAKRAAFVAALQVGWVREPALFSQEPGDHRVAPSASHSSATASAAPPSRH